MDRALAIQERQEATQLQEQRQEEMQQPQTKAKTV